MDTTANVLTIIRNGYMAAKKEVFLPYSLASERLVKLIAEKGFLGEIDVKGKEAAEKKIVIRLKYFGKTPAIRKIRRVSRPGRKFYVKVDSLPYSLGGKGMYIVSTSKGLMTDNEARKLKIGGEVICEVF